MRSLNTLIFSLLILMLPAYPVLADSWSLPKTRTVCSSNNRYCLKVIPKKLTSQLDYFQDNVDGKENAGGDRKVKKNLCRGVFFARQSNGTLKKQWETNLVNEVSPVSVLVSDKGDYVVTFDNWHSVGYGDDAIAIYAAADGRVVKQFGLSEFLTGGDISALPTSASSIWWGGHHYLDNKQRQLVLQVAENGRLRYEEKAKFFGVRVDLSDGRILDEKRDRLPRVRFTIQTTDIEVKDVAPPTSLQDAECFESGVSDRISSSDLLKRARHRELPDYPPAAQAVRAVGQVTTQILIDSDGTVKCARAVTGHPLLRRAIVAALMKWKFGMADGPYSGFITFEGEYALVGPDGRVITEPSH